MSKHSKNNTSKAFFTNFERAREQGLKSGTAKLRLGRDSMKPFDACSITLEPVVNPVADLEGHIYSKTAIFDHVMEQNRLYKLQLKAYKKEQEELKKTEDASSQNSYAKKIADFEAREKGITSQLEKNEVNNLPQTKLSTTTLNSYWIPELAPEAKPDAVAKPSKILKSPFGKPIKLKELVSLTLTPIPDADPNQTGRYMCPLCKKCLNNVKGVCCLKSCGHVFCTTCFDSLLKKDMICPISNISFTEDEILNLESEGSSFACRSADKLIATTKNPVARFG
jgi:nitric oxide synthase-interacting protein